MSKLIEFLAFVAILYLFDALWEFVRTERNDKLIKFIWMCVGFAAIKAIVRAAVWAVNL